MFRLSRVLLSDIYFHGDGTIGILLSSLSVAQAPIAVRMAKEAINRGSEVHRDSQIFIYIYFLNN